MSAQPPKPKGKKKRAVRAKVFDEDDTDVYEAERIVGERKRKGKKEYLVAWKGYDEQTYEPARNLPNALLEAWKKEKRV